MVGRQRAECGGQRRAVQVGQLLGVQLDRQALRARRLEHAARLGGREADAFAEGVDRVGQALGGDGGDHLAADQVDVAVRVAGELGRQGVRAQEGGGRRDTRRSSASARAARSDLQLVVQRRGRSRT